MGLASRLSTLTILAALSFTACTCGDDLVSKVCPQACYTGPEGTLGLGQCHAGTSSCSPDGKVIHCFGETLPSAEVCDGVDNRCVGNHRWRDGVEDPGYWKDCGSPNVGACKPGKTICVGAQLKCGGTYTGEVVPKEEDCSGRDLDCDGIVNNIKKVVCYDGNPDDLNTSQRICKAGETGCLGGVQMCIGEVLPRPEPSDSTIDLNCDGYTGGCTRQGVDVVVIWNRTAVLWRWEPRIVDALRAFATTHSDPNIYRYAIVDEPAMPLDFVNKPNLALPFSNSQDFVFEMETWDQTWGGWEWPNDAIVGACDQGPDGYGLDWRPGAKHIIWSFQDDDDSIDEPDFYITAKTTSDAIRAAVALPAEVSTWTDDPGSSYPAYQAIASATNGKLSFLEFSTTSTAIFITLEQLAQSLTTCR